MPVGEFGTETKPCVRLYPEEEERWECHGKRRGMSTSCSDLDLRGCGWIVREGKEVKRQKKKERKKKA